VSECLSEQGDRALACSTNRYLSFHSRQIDASSVESVDKIFANAIGEDFDFFTEEVELHYGVRVVALSFPWELIVSLKMSNKGEKRFRHCIHSSVACSGSGSIERHLKRNCLSIDFNIILMRLISF
jgi:hypothetical protein